MVGLVWVAVLLQLRNERNRAEYEAILSSGTLVRTLAENVTRTINEADAALIFVRSAYEKDSKGFVIADWLGANNYKSNLLLQTSIVGPDGLIKTSTVGPSATAIDLSDREHFRFHVDSRDDQLHVSKPVIARTTGKPSIQLTRRIRDADGSFGGIVSTSFDPEYFVRLYRSIDIGRNGLVSLIGLDGVLRASAGLVESKIGISLLETKPFELVRQSHSGHFFGEGDIDGVRRLVSFHRVDGYPLVVTVGLAEDEILAGYRRDRELYFGAAAALTLLILAVVAIGIRSAMRLDRTRAELATQNRLFEAALENMPQGLAMFDAERRLVICNRRYAELYGHAPDELAPGTPMRRIFEHRLARGVYADSAVQESPTWQAGRAIVDTNETRKLDDGRCVAVAIRQIVGGGYVTTHEDVTEARRSEASFQLLFSGNPVPMWVFDVETLRFLAVNEAAVERYGYSREQFLAMTVLDIRPLEDRDKFASFVEAEGGVHEGEQIWRHRTSSGSAIDVAIYSRSLRYEGRAAALVAAVDVTDRMRAEREVLQTKAFLDTLIENVPVPIMVKAAQTLRYVFVNRATELLFGRQRDRIIGRTAYDLFPKRTAEDITALDCDALRSREATLTERRRLNLKGDQERAITSRRVAVPGDDGKPQYLLGVLEDITERTRSEERIAHMAHHDALTGLANRTLFAQRLGEMADRCRRLGRRFALHMLDLDRFKEINDSLGHPMGDGLLKQAAGRLVTSVGEAGVVARLGGDEFAILQPIDDDPRESAIMLASRIAEAVGAPYELEGQRISIGTSIGIALAPDHGEIGELLLKNADLALYKVKAEGRNAFRFFEPEMEATATARRALEADLRAAIGEEDIGVHYQPVIDIRSQATVGVEALVRWRHRERGMVSPAEFIPHAEETGLILPLGEWILRKVCSDTAGWPNDIKVAVNLSAVQFKKGNLLEMVTSALVDSGLAPERLELEITESVLLQQSDENIAVLHQLRELGVSIVLDDFGTGYSSLSYLRAFPFDKIKIDKSFVNDISTRSDCAAIVCAVIGMARSLDVITTAEGVESREQLELLDAAGCTQAQGYLFGAAVPACELRFSGESRATRAA
jgi:diguanylate cyclase (GGDEF)-like protein/PAS domain S-box-containing protein